jgi:DNA-binding transcriptional ArsR family regulator
MVDRLLSLDSVFGSLSSPVRRDILQRVARDELTVTEISKPYNLTFAAISKHLKILEKAKLIIKRRRGKEQLVTLAPQTLEEAAEYLDHYKKLWEDRLDSLEEYLKTIK